MVYKTVCNKCSALVEVDDDTGAETYHQAPCVPSGAPEIGVPEAEVPGVG